MTPIHGVWSARNEGLNAESRHSARKRLNGWAREEIKPKKHEIALLSYFQKISRCLHLINGQPGSTAYRLCWLRSSPASFPPNHFENVYPRPPTTRTPTSFQPEMIAARATTILGFQVDASSAEIERAVLQAVTNRDKERAQGGGQPGLLKGITIGVRLTWLVSQDSAASASTQEDNFETEWEEDFLIKLIPNTSRHWFLVSLRTHTRRTRDFWDLQLSDDRICVMAWWGIDYYLRSENLRVSQVH